VERGLHQLDVEICVFCPATLPSGRGGREITLAVGDWKPCFLTAQLHGGREFLCLNAKTYRQPLVSPTVTDYANTES